VTHDLSKSRTKLAIIQKETRSRLEDLVIRKTGVTPSSFPGVGMARRALTLKNANKDFIKSNHFDVVIANVYKAIKDTEETVKRHNVAQISSAL
jgi:hypothetical protein